MARVVLPASKIKARRKRRRIVAISILVGIVVALFGAFALLANASFMRISNITVRGAQTIATSTIEQKIRAQLTGSYLFVFPKDNILFYPNGRIEAALIAAMPTIASASVHAENFQTISVTVVERKPKALWCGNTPSNPMPCFFLDESGKAYGAAQNFSDTTYANYFGSLSVNTNPKAYLTEDTFRALSALVDTIAASQKSATLRSVYVDDNQDVHVAFDTGFTLLFTLSADGGDVFQRFTLALQSDPFKNHALSDFEYLDLRFGDKLYYKLKSI